MSTDILGNLSDDLAYMAENFDEFATTSTQTRFDLGIPAKFFWETGKEPDIKRVPCTWQFNGGKLTQLEIVNHQRGDGQPIKLLQGRLSGVDARLLIEVDGTMMSPYQLLHARMGGNVSLEDFMAQCFAKGLKWESSEMQLHFQHFSPDMSVVEKLTQAMIENSAENVTSRIPVESRGRLEARWDFKPGRGLAVTSIVASRSDREASKTNQGFLDFADAAIGNFAKMVQITRTVTALQISLDEKIAKGDLDEEVRLEISKTIAERRQSANSWNNNWGGSQEGLEKQPDGTYQPTGAWFRVRVPIPRMTIEIGNETEEFIFVTEGKTEDSEAAVAAPEGIIDATEEEVATKVSDEIDEAAS